MLFNINSLSLTMVCTYARPAIVMPKFGHDILDKFFTALSPQFNIALKDIQNFGGVSLADFKISLLTFRGKGRVDITPAVLGAQVGVDLIKTQEDLKIVIDYFSLCEDTLTASLAEIIIAERIFTANIWIDCEGGSEAALRFLRERGEAGFKLPDGAFGDYEKEFTIQATLSKQATGARHTITLQRSHLEGTGDLYVSFETSYPVAGLLDTVPVHFARSKDVFYELTREIGLQAREE